MICKYIIFCHKKYYYTIYVASLCYDSTSAHDYLFAYFYIEMFVVAFQILDII